MADQTIDQTSANNQNSQEEAKSAFVAGNTSLRSTKNVNRNVSFKLEQSSSSGDALQLHRLKTVKENDDSNSESQSALTDSDCFEDI